MDKRTSEDIEDAGPNTTRFPIMAGAPVIPHPKAHRSITSFVFPVRNVPAALYKALGGFATNGVTMTKLESTLLGGNFIAARFHADVQAHPEDRNLALEDLAFFSHEVKILGVHPAHPYRLHGDTAEK